MPRAFASSVKARGPIRRRLQDKVRDAVDMVDLVGTRTELRRAGATGTRACARSTTSARRRSAIDPAQKLYHCFGCGEGGDCFSFVQETEGLDFVGALEWLAERYGVELELEDEDPAGGASVAQRRERLLELLERATTFYVRHLWESAEAAPARDYLKSRGLEEATLREFRVGYAPSAWDTLLLGRAEAGLLRPGDPRLRARGAREGAGAHLRPLPPAHHVPARRPPRARAGLRRAGARPRPAAEVPELAGGRALPQGAAAVRRRPRAGAGGQGRRR